MKLNSKHKQAAEMLVDFPEMTLQEIAAALGVTKVTLWRWRKEPEFQEYERGLCEDRFRELQAIAIKKLGENVTKCNQSAIQYVLDYCGFKAAQSVNIKENTINVTVE